MSDSNELAQHPIDDLVKELSRRANGNIIIYAEFDKKGREDPSQAYMYIGGSAIQGMGMAAALKVQAEYAYTAQFCGKEEDPEDEQ
jgi:hypothetical protein